MEYELKLSEKEVNLVLTGLGQLSYINSAELINKVRLACVKHKADEKIEETE
jgi:hypothetical protein